MSAFSRFARALALLGLTATAAAAQTAPEIRIAPPVETQSTEAADPAEAAIPETGLDPALVVRDGSAEAVEANERQVHLGLRPLAAIPREIVMGASLPQPGILRLTGETAAFDLALWLPEGAALPQHLNLSLRSAIDILPETATVSVAINGTPAAELPLKNFDGFHALQIDATGLVPGFNRIGLNLRQPHRIFCGPNASFDVWTELDLHQSGATIPASAFSADAASFSLLLGNQIAAGLPLPITVGSDVDPALLRQLGVALGEVMQGSTQGQIEIQSFYQPAKDQDARIALIASGQSRASYRQNGDGAITLLIEYAENTLPDLTDVLPPPIAPDLAHIPVLTPGRPVTLAELGQPDLIANTRYFRQDIAFTMPDDWLLLANQKAVLGLHYGSADDLPKGSMLLVKVNDETIRLLPLDRDGGQLLEPLAIRFGARLLGPGLNRLSFEMMVPGDPADVACPIRQTDMLVVTNDTSIYVPKAPAMQLRGISGPLASLDAAGIRVAESAVDRRSLDLAAAQLAAGLVPAQEPDPEVSLSLVDIAGFPYSRDGLSRRVLQDALFPPISAASQPQGAAVPALAASSAPAPSRYRLSQDDPETTKAAAAPKSDDQAPLEGSWIERLRSRIERASFMTSTEDLQSWLQRHHGSALILPIAEDRPLDMWLVLGPDADLPGVTQALNGLRQTGIGEGKAALLSNAGDWQIWSAPQVPRVLGMVTPLNLMPVLGNYASWSPLVFTLALLGLSALSVIPALAIVIIFRKRRLR